MAGVQRIIIPYSPREQFWAYHNRTQRWACGVAHRRCGKTVAAVNELIKGALSCQWGYVKQFSSAVPGIEINESELRVDFPNGGRVRLYGAENYERLRGVWLDGVVLDEFGDMDPRVWPEVIRPALSDRQGWATFIGTPKGRNSFHELYETAKQNPAEWFTFLLRASETGILPESELADARKSQTPEQYAQEYECSFDAAIIGAYYGKEIADAEREGRVCELPVDPVLPTHTSWDLGKTGSTSIWFFQMTHGGIRVIDFYENQMFDLDHYADELKSRGYTYGTHFLPHDARQGILGMKRTRIEQIMALMKGHGICDIVRDHGVMDGIHAAKLTLKRCWFDQERCKFGLEALRQYRAEFDEKAKVFKSNPKQDWSSHCADSFRYLAMAWHELKAPEIKKPKPTALVFEVTPAGETKSNLTWAEMMKMRERKAKRGLRG
jgi:hypothetical protein